MAKRKTNGASTPADRAAAASPPLAAAVRQGGDAASSLGATSSPAHTDHD